MTEKLLKIKPTQFLHVIEKAGPAPKPAFGGKGAGPSAGKRTVYWQGEGSRRPLTINMDSPVPQGYGEQPKQKQEGTGEVKEAKQVKETKQEKPEAPKAEKYPESKTADDLRKIAESPAKLSKEQIHPDIPKKIDSLNEGLDVVLNKLEEKPNLTGAEFRLWNYLYLTKLEANKQAKEFGVGQPLSEIVAGIDKKYDKLSRGGKEKDTVTTSDMRKYLQDMKDKRAAGQELTREERKTESKYKGELGRWEKEDIETEIQETEERKQAEMDAKAKDYVANFENIVKPYNEIQKPVITKSDLAELNQGEKDNPTKDNPEAPNKLATMKQKYSRSVNKLLSQMGMKPKGKVSDRELANYASIDKISVKGASVKITLDAPAPHISRGQINEFGDNLGRIYGVDKVDMQYENGKVVYSFPKQDISEIVQPTLADGIKAIQKVINDYVKEHPNEPRPIVIPMGFDADGELVYANVLDGNANSIAVIAAPGQGKSFGAESTIMQLISVYSPEEFELSAYDTQGVSLPTVRKSAEGYFTGNPVMGIQTKEDVNNLLNGLENDLQEATNRASVLKKYGVEKLSDLSSKAGGRTFKTRLVMFDEYNSVFGKIDEIYGKGKESAVMKKRISGMMDRLKDQGRKVGIIPMALGQDPTEDNSKRFMTTAQAKVLYRVPGSVGTRFLGAGGTAAARNLVAKGQALIEIAGERKYGVGPRRNNNTNNNFSKLVAGR